MTDYFAHPGINISSLVHMRKSPMHYQHAVTAGTFDTEALRFGRLVHMAILEPDRFVDSVAVWEGESRRGNEYKAWKLANASKVQATMDEMEAVEGIASAVRRHPMAAAYFAEGQAEHPIYWKSGDLECKSRLDFITPEGAIVDLKTTRDCTPRAFFKSVAEYDMHVRAAYYCDAYEYERGNKPSAFVLVAVEKVPPYACGVYQMDDMALACGRQEYQRLLDLVRECRATGEWPGPTGYGMQSVELPLWAAGLDTPVELVIDGEGLSV